jgi:hypothetical protein
MEVKEPGGNGHHVELQVSQKVGHFERMHHVGLAGVTDLTLVFERREDVGAAEQLEIGVGAVGPHLLDEVLEANHGERCLTIEYRWTCLHHRGGSGGGQGDGGVGPRLA